MMPVATMSGYALQQCAIALSMVHTWAGCCRFADVVPFLCALAVEMLTFLAKAPTPLPQDPVRKEVPDAVAVCKRAGIFVRMVTGDNVHTASHIARECGIMMEGGLALEGPTFRKMTEEELIPILPKLQVS